jgi:hypothetical protein
MLHGSSTLLLTSFFNSVVFLTLPMVCGTVVLCGILSGLYFVLGVHPYRFIIFILYEMIFPTFNVILLIFARKKSKVVTTVTLSASATNEAGKRSSKIEKPSTAQVFSSSNLVPGTTSQPPSFGATE